MFLRIKYTMLKNAYTDCSLSELRTALKTDYAHGLSSEQAQNRLNERGLNELNKGKNKSLARRFFSQFLDLSIIILLLASALSFVCSLISEEKADIFEPFIILAIVVLNAALGTIQEYKAEKSLKALAKLTGQQTVVIRDGVERHVESTNVVYGDIVTYSEGDVISADARVLFSSSLTVNEAPLTGEALPVEKDTLKKDGGMLYSGCYVLSGRCKAVVTATGMDTEIGKVALALGNHSEQKTPLQQKLQKLSKQLGLGCLALCAVVFLLCFFSGLNSSGNTTDLFLSALMTSVSLAVACIPEGLPAVVVIVLSMSVVEMAERNVIIRKLPSVETLGSVTVICSDKTGTLTQNKMSLKLVCDGEKEQSDFDKDAKEVLSLAAACCSAHEINGVFTGDATETAILQRAKKERISINGKAEKLYEIPFTSERKMMSVAVKRKDTVLLVTKGAFESIAPLSHNASDFAERYQALAKRGFRVLTLAVRELPAGFVKSKKLENDLTVKALLALYDPPKSNVKEAVKNCYYAKVRPVMVTGDSLLMAEEVAKELGIFRDGDTSVDGKTLATWSDEYLQKQIDRISVFARVTPWDKVRIVTALKRNKEVVAMTGDGVNDAPALKRADIGCAMGSGSEVAKSASDLVIADDNFATVVEGIGFGRRVFESIIKTVSYLLSCNFGEVIAVFLCLLLCGRVPFSPFQLLWLNLVTDGLPSIALGMEKIDRDLMKDKPKAKDELLSKRRLVTVCVFGVLFALSTLSAYFVGSLTSVSCASTMAFLTLSLAEVLYALPCSAERLLVRSRLSKTTLSFFAVSVTMLLAVTLIRPVAETFSLASLTAKGYLLCLLFALIPFFASELRKLRKVTARSLAKGNKIVKDNLT